MPPPSTSVLFKRSISPYDPASREPLLQEYGSAKNKGALLLALPEAMFHLFQDDALAFGFCFVVIAQPLLDFNLRLGFPITIALLQNPDEFFRFSAQLGQVIIRELGPLLSHLSFKFMPLPEDNILGCTHNCFSLLQLKSPMVDF
jgi:hypothetical protein